MMLEALFGAGVGKSTRFCANGRADGRAYPPEVRRNALIVPVGDALRAAGVHPNSTRKWDARLAACGNLVPGEHGHRSPRGAYWRTQSGPRS